MSIHKKLSNTEAACNYHSRINAGSSSAGPEGNCYTPWIAGPKANGRSSAFASALAHEVRSPLASINLSAELLKSAILDDELKMYVDIIRRNATRINDLIIGFLKYQDEDEVTEEKYFIGRMVDEVLGIVSDRIRLKEITVIKDFCGEDFKTISNKPKMKIALTNIIINAIDAMPSVKGVLKLSLRSGNDEYELKIEDNGCGISKENLQSIFKAGFTNKPGGLGFGLQMTNDILQSNHIRVKVESVEGKWTRFTLLFPADFQPGNSIDKTVGVATRVNALVGVNVIKRQTGKIKIDMPAAF